MEQKQNDMLLNIMSNPSFDITDFQKVGLDVDNTSLQTKDVYQNSPQIQSTFKNSEGNFDQTAFNQMYNKAAVAYNYMANQKADQDFQRYYSKYDPWAPKEKVDQTPQFNINTKEFNPDRTSYSIIKVGQEGPRTKTPAEIAQGMKVHNLKTGELEDAPEESFFGTVFGDVKVLAAYDADVDKNGKQRGESGFDENNIVHHEGELKIDPTTGTYYYETLNGRNIHGKQVLHMGDIITREDSPLNSIDVLDSDDIHKSGIGSFVKNAALIGSLFVPGVGPYIVGATILQQALGLGATLGKIATSSDNGVFNFLQGVSEATNLSTSRSEYAQQNLWTMENLFGMVADTVTQLTQQRMLFQQLPKLLGKDGRILTEEGQKAMQKELMERFNAVNPLRGKVPEGATVDLLNAQQKITLWNQTKATQALEKYMKDYYNIGGTLSKAYMTLLTVNDMYDEAKQAGASDTVAALTTLGYAAGEYALLSTGLGEWILPELRQGRMQSKAMVRALSRDTLRTFEIEGRKATTAEAKHKFYSKVINFGKKIFNADYAVGRQGTLGKTIQSTVAGGLGEGFEEVSEDVLQDFVKRLYNLGNTAFGSDSRMHTENWQDQYLMDFLGGFLGGGIANVSSSFQTAKASQNMTTQEAMQKLVYTMRNPEEFSDFMKVLDRTEIGNKYLSTKEITDENGNRVGYEQGTKDDNQDKFVKNLIKSNINLIQTTLASDGANLSNEDLLKEVLPDLKWQYLYNSTSTAYLIQRYNDLATQALSLRNEINNSQLSDPKMRENSPEAEVAKAHIKELNDKLKTVQDEIQNIRDGKYTARYMADALLETTPLLMNSFLRSATFKGFAETKTGEKFEDISDARLDNLRKEFVDYLHTDAKYDIHQATEIYLNFQRMFKDYLEKVSNDYLTVSQAPLEQTIGRVNSVLNADNVDEALENAQRVEDFENSISNKDVTGSEEYDNLRNDFDSKLRSGDLAAANNVLGQVLTAQDTFLTNLETFLRTQQLMLPDNLPAITKQNLLNRLNKLKSAVEQDAAYWEDILNSGIIYDLGIDSTITRLYNLVYQNSGSNQKSPIDQLIDEVNNASYTPIMEIADQFDLAVNGNPTTFSKLFEQLRQIEDQSSGDVTQFAIPKDLGEKIGQAMTLLQQLEAMVEGARTDGAGLELIDPKSGKVKDNIWGINATLNQVGKEANEWEDLPEIDGTAADAILVDIRAMQSKLMYYTTLYGINQGQKLASQPRINTKIAYLMYNKLKVFADTVPDDWDKSKLTQAIQACTFLDEHSNDTTLNLSTDDYAKLKSEQIQLEDAVYDFLQNNLGKDFSELFSGDFVLTTNKTLLNETTENIDNNSFIGWLAAKGAVKTSTFLRTLQPILNSRPELVPLDSQLMSVQLAVANAINGKQVTKIIDAATNSAIYYLNDLRKDKPTFIKFLKDKLNISENLATVYSTNAGFKYIQNNDFFYRWKNISLIEGIAGSGKSSAVLQLTADYLKSNYKLDNPWVVNTTEQSKEALKQKLGSTGNAYTKEELLGIISNYQTPKINEDGSITLDNTNTIVDRGKITSNATLKDVSDLPKVIFIDEISRFTTQELDILDKFAQKNGISIIVAGDFDQSQTTGKVIVNNIASADIQNIISEVNVAKIDLGNGAITLPANYKLGYLIDTSRNNLLHTPKIGTAIRTENSQIDVNQSTVIAAQESLATDNTYSVDIKLHYFENDSELRGTKVVRGYDQLKQITDFLDKVIPNLNGEKIGFTYFKDGDASIFHALSTNQKYKDHIDFYRGNTAQGFEAKYWIIETNPNVDTETYMKDVYTGITRAKVGSILITPKMWDSSAQDYNPRVNTGITGIESVQDVDSTQIHLNESEKKAFNEKYSKLMDVVLEQASDTAQPLVDRTQSVNPSQPPTPPTQQPPTQQPPVQQPPANPQPAPGNSTPAVVFDQDVVDKARQELNNAAQSDLQDLKDLYKQYSQIKPTSAEDQKRLQVFLDEVQQQIDSKQITVQSGVNFNNLQRTLEILPDGSKKFTYSYADGSNIQLNIDWINNVFGKTYKNQEDLKYITVSSDGTITLQEQNRQSTISSTNNPDLLELIKDVPSDIGGEVTTDDGGQKLQDQEAEQNKGNIEASLTSYWLTSDLTDPCVQQDINKVMDIKQTPWGAYRIDGLYGMYDSQGISKFGFDSVKDSVRALNQMFGYILNTPDKAQLTEYLKAILQTDKQISLTYAIKSGQTNKHPEGNSANFGKFDKTEEEAGPNGFKELIAIIAIDGKDELEIPISKLNSPQSKITSLIGAETWQGFVNGAGNEGRLLLDLFNNPNHPVWNIIKNSLGNSFTSQEISTSLNSLYEWLDVYLKTNNSREIWYCPDDNWTVANMDSFGPQWDVNRGKWYVNDSNNLRQGSPITSITDHLNGRIYTSEVFLINSRDNTRADGTNYVEYPDSMFILFSSDPELNNSDALWKQYLKQLDNPNTPQKVKVKYLQTPIVSISTYLQSIQRFTLGGKEGAKKPPFGNRTTAYKVVRALFNARNSESLLKEYLGEDTYNYVKDRVSELDGISESNLFNKLRQASDWGNFGYTNRSSNTQFINVLTKLISKQTDDLSTANFVTKFNQERADKIAELFNTTRNKIYLSAKIKNNRGILRVLDVTKDYRINIDTSGIDNVNTTLNMVGKLGTDMFVTDDNFNAWISSARKNTVPTRNGRQYTSTENSRYLNGTTTPVQNSYTPRFQALVDWLKKAGIILDPPQSANDSGASQYNRIVQELQKLGYLATVVDGRLMYQPKKLSNNLKIALPSNLSFGGNQVIAMNATGSDNKIYTVTIEKNGNFIVRENPVIQPKQEVTVDKAIIVKNFLDSSRTVNRNSPLGKPIDNIDAAYQKGDIETSYNLFMEFYNKYSGIVKALLNNAHLDSNIIDQFNACNIKL